MTNKKSLLSSDAIRSVLLSAFFTILEKHNFVCIPPHSEQIVRGHGVSSKNDHFLTLKSKALHSSALIGFENKRNILPRHVFQAICELLLMGAQTCMPFIQVIPPSHLAWHS
jgi:hypothetical protein